jgi:hypothetical protein
MSYIPGFTAQRSLTYSGVAAAQPVMAPSGDPVGCFVDYVVWPFLCAYYCWTPTGFQQSGGYFAC